MYIVRVIQFSRSTLLSDVVRLSGVLKFRQDSP